MKSIHLRLQVLVPLILLLTILLGAFAISVATEWEKHIQDEFSNELTALQNHYKTITEERAKSLGSLLTLILTDQSLTTLIKNEDRLQLLKQTRNTFEKLRSNHGITHLYFHSANMLNILRVHQPNRYGDLIQRFTMLDAFETGNVSHGVELGPLGSFTLRVVKPLYDSNTLIGYIEIGEEIDQMFSSSIDALNVSIIATIDKQYLQQKGWEDGVKVLGHNSHWDTLSNAVVLTKSINIPNSLLQTFSNKPISENRLYMQSFEDRHFNLAVLALKDAGFRQVGKLIVFKEITKRVHKYQAFIIIFTLSLTVVFGFLTAFFYWLLGRVETKIRQDQEHIADSKRYMGGILKHSWNEIYTYDAQNFKLLEASEGACQNLGYSQDEIKSFYVTDLMPELKLRQFESLIDPLKNGTEMSISFESEHVRKDGSRYPIEVRFQLSNIQTMPVIIGIIQDISERTQYIKQLEYKALYDHLTNLPNRSLLKDRINHELSRARREESMVSIFLIDVRRLKEVNEILGYISGDNLLIEVATRLKQIVRKSDTISSMGGDEFALVLPSVNMHQAPLIAEKIHSLFEQSIVIENTALDVEVAIGMAIYPDHGENADLLIQHADIAMQLAKNDVNAWSIYNPENDPRSLHKLKLQGELRQALINKELRLYYQPQIDIETKQVISVEALARWPHATLGMIAPDNFIPMIESSGLIRPFTMWVLQEAMQQRLIWSEQGINIIIGINLSARNIIDQKLPILIRQLLIDNKVKAEHFTLEVTESAIMSRPDIAIQVLMELHEMGFRLSIDDFGTGYSSLAYLKKLPVSELKIDQSFVFGLTSNNDDLKIVKSTIDLSHNMDLKVIAEGVESEEILDVLTTLQCDIAQGYFISKPKPADEFISWLNASTWYSKDPK